MRGIKFRAWDKKNKRMIYLRPFQALKFIGNKWYIADGFIDEGLEDIENFILLQYTGLLDKNDKEIYEGDILELIDKEKIKCWRSVYWSNDSGMWCLSKCYNGTWDIENNLPAYYGKEHKIIGNIYENSELLKEINL